MILSIPSIESKNNLNYLNSPLDSPISQQDITFLLSKADAKKYVHVASLLEENGYSSTISHIPLHANWSQNTTVDFSGCQFESVEFTGNFVNTIFSGDFSNCLFSDTKIDHCLFKNSSIDHSAFVNTNFYNVVIDSSEIKHTWFLNDQIERVAFNNNDFQHAIFCETTLENVSAAGNKAEHVGLINTPFDFNFNSSSVYIVEEQPTVGIVGQSQWHTSAEKAMQFYNIATLTINPYQLPKYVLSNLENDVKKAIRNYYQFDHDEVSIPQFILNSNYPSIKALNQIAKEYVDEVDAVWIPGVLFDIHPEFYGKAKKDFTDVADSYTREMFEFSLIHEALAQHKPIIGVCHGSQMINIYFGGDLYQNVPGQFANQVLTIETPTGIIGDAIKGSIVGMSMHHQAIHHIGKGLELVATYEGVIKSCQAIDGSPILLTQFHPEYLNDRSNKNIVIHYIEAAEKWHSYTEALALSDILEVNTPYINELELKYKEGGFKFVDASPSYSFFEEQKMVPDTYYSFEL